MVWKLVWKLVITVILCKLSNLKFKLGYLLDSGEIFIQLKPWRLHQYQGRYCVTKEGQNVHQKPLTNTKKSINIQPVVVNWGGMRIMFVPEVCQNIYPATPHPQTHPTLLWLWLVKSFLWLPYCLIELVAHLVIVNREKWVDNFKSQLIKSWLGWSGEPESLLIEIDVTMSDYFFQCQEWMVVLEV